MLNKIRYHHLVSYTYDLPSVELGTDPPLLLLSSIAQVTVGNF
jgi:hypothetical protein